MTVICLEICALSEVTLHIFREGSRWLEPILNMFGLCQLMRPPLKSHINHATSFAFFTYRQCWIEPLLQIKLLLSLVRVQLPCTKYL